MGLFHSFLSLFLTRGSPKYISEWELSEDECDENYFIDNMSPPLVEPPEEDRMNPPLIEPPEEDRLDAVVRPPISSFENNISLQSLSTIEDQLDDYEMVSLLYLLYENSDVALQVLEAFIQSKKKAGLLYKWAQSEHIEERKWQKKIIEALCIVQNYQILQNLGYKKTELQQEFLPFQCRTSCAVNKLRKVLYLTAEKLTKVQTQSFIQNMKRKLSGDNIACPDYDPDYLEMYLIYWELRNVKIRDIQQVFKSMDLELISDQLESVIPSESCPISPDNQFSSNKSLVIEPNLNERKTSTTKDNTYLPTGSYEQLSFNTSQAGMSGMFQENQILDSNKYPIDSENPGVALIINQEFYYTEPEEKYKHLLHEYKDEILLEDRVGTEMDKERLKNLFTRMKFKVIVEENLTHIDMLAKIQEVTEGISHESSLIICILSHGDKGVVYGANSCKVDVNKIQNIMCRRNKKLIGKPKVLILQSCQGARCQKGEEENEEDDNEGNLTDGPTKVPATADLLTFWATIPGYAAIRNVNKGSWFIQALCDEIEEGHSRYHFLDICTRIVDKVTQRKWKEESGINVMTPMVVFTLTKSFYLPRPSI